MVRHRLIDRSGERLRLMPYRRRPTYSTRFAWIDADVPLREIAGIAMHASDNGPSCW